MKIIDSHQHFWKYDPVDLPWITDKLSVLKKDFLPEDLKKVYQKNNVDGCVAVQAAQTDGETHFLLEMADKNPFIKGVVGWIDLESPNLEEQLNAYVPFSKLKGFRHILQDEEDARYILRPGFQQGLKILFEKDYTYDVLVFPHQLEGAVEAIRQFPDAPFVIDHLAKPYIAKKEIEAWGHALEPLKDFPNVYCKVSGMVTENDWGNWHLHDFFPYLDVVMEVFGENRLMFGSDWPVCLVAADYSQVKRIVEEYFQGFSPEAKQKIWVDNAVSFYKLTDSMS